jgi:hypothetical protein
MRSNHSSIAIVNSRVARWRPRHRCAPYKNPARCRLSRPNSTVSGSAKTCFGQIHPRCRATRAGLDRSALRITPNRILPLSALPFRPGRSFHSRCGANRTGRTLEARRCSAAPSRLAQSLWIAIPLSALIGTGFILQRRLPLAIASHLSLLYSALLVYDIVAPSGSPGFAVNLLCGPAGLVAIPIFLASLLSSTISHRAYWRDILLGAHGSDAVASYFSGRTAAAQQAL